MAYQYPLNGGRINATIGGNTVGAGSLVSTGTLTLAGGNNVTLSQNGNAITISAATGLTSQSNQALSGSNGSFTFQTATFGNSNGLSFYTTNGSMVGSYTVPTQTAYSFSNANGVSFGTNGSTVTATVATTYAASNHSHGNPTLNLTNLSGTTASASNGLSLSLSAASQTAQTQSNIQGIIASGSTNRTGDISFANSNGVTFGLSNNTITASVAPGGGGVALYDGASSISSGTASISAGGALTASVNGQTLSLNVPAQSSLSETGIVSISRNGSTISIGAPAFSIGMSTLGNTSGTSGTVSNRLIFAGGSNITLSQSTGASGNTISIIGGAGGGGGGIALANSQTTYTSGTANMVVAGGAMTIASTTGQSFNFSVPATSSMSATGALSISTNGATVSIGVPAQTNQTLGLYGVSNTTQGTSGTVDARTLSFRGAGAASVGISNGSVVISAPNAAAGNVTFSAGTLSGGYASLVFSNSNGVSFGLSGSTLTASAAGGAGGGVALYDGANSISSGTANISASGALTASVNGQTLSLNVPEQSYLTGQGIVGLTSSSNTISVGGAMLTAFVNQLPASTGSQTLGTMGVTSGSAQYYPVSIHSNVQFNALRIAMSLSYATSAVSGRQTVSHSYGLYSNNANTLSLISSGGLSYAVTNSGVSATLSAATATGTAGYSYGTITASTTAQIHSNFGTVGLRAIDLQFGNTMTLAPGMYWLGMLRRESFSSANIGISAALAGNVVAPMNSLGLIGTNYSALTTNSALKSPYMGFGPYTSTAAAEYSGTALPSSVFVSGIAHTGSVLPFMTFIST